MVWRYTEESRCPNITDWVGQKFKFGICLDEDATDIGTRLIETATGVYEQLQVKINGKLRPRFYMRVGENTNSVLNYEFDLYQGLVRRLWTFGSDLISIASLPGEYQRLTPNVLDTGEFQDFFALGSYAVERFPKIAEEVVMSPFLYQDDVPEEDRPSIEACFHKTEDVPSWGITQRDLSKAFHDLIAVYSVFEATKKGLEKRKSPFTEQQVKKLLRLVEPLKQ